MRGPKLGLRTTFFILLSIGILLFDHRTSYLVRIRVVLTDLVSPIQYVVNWPLEFVSWVNTSVSTHGELLRENTSLKAQQILLNAEIEKFIALEKENEQLRALLASSPKIASTKILVAQVLAVDTAPYVKQIVIDRGQKDNLFVGQAVIDASGVVGQVVQTADYSSRVMLLSDVQSSIPVENTRNELRGIVNGNGTYDDLRLIHMPTTADIQVGDKLVSSGLGLRYPEGYPVGTVTQVVHDPSLPFLDITVSPAAGLSRSRLVLLIWPTQQKILQSAKEQLNVLQRESRKTQLIRGQQ